MSVLQELCVLIYEPALRPPHSDSSGRVTGAQVPPPARTRRQQEQSGGKCPTPPTVHHIGASLGVAEGGPGSSGLRGIWKLEYFAMYGDKDYSEYPESRKPLRGLSLERDPA